MHVSGLYVPNVHLQFSVTESLTTPHTNCYCAQRKQESALGIPSASEGSYDRVGFA